MDSTTTSTTTSHQEFSFADLHLQPAFQQASDPIFDPRWQNIYQQSDNTSSNFDWMHYRQPEDALSSASSSSDGSYYTHSVYSASSEPLNPLNYYQQQQQYQDPFATSTLAPSTRQPSDDANAWIYAQHNSAANPYQHTTGGADPYQHHPNQRDSGEYESYSSGGEDQPHPLPHFSALAPSPHHQPNPPQQDQYGQQQQMYMPFNDSTSGGASGASPYGGHAKASDLYASPPPPNANAYGKYDPTTSDGRIPSGNTNNNNNGGAYPSPYASPSSQQQQQQPQQRGPGGSRLTPVLSQLSIDPITGYPPSPLSPQNGQPQQQQQPGSSSAAGGNGAYSSPGPSRNSHSRSMMMAQSAGGSAASSPYGRPAGHHHSHPQRYVQHSHSHSHSTSSSVPSSTSAASSQSQQQQQQPQSIFSPSGVAGGGKIFATNGVVLPPIDGSHSHQHPSLAQSQPTLKPMMKAVKEMIPGTPTHPDIPRPAVVAAPVPVPHLTKKSRGRQVPSVNAVGVPTTAAAAAPAPNHSRSRDRSGAEVAHQHQRAPSVRKSARERSWEADALESPLSPPGGTGAGAGGYFGQQQQWSEDEDRNMNPLAHGHRSLFGGPGPMPGSGAGPSHNQQNQTQTAGSTSSMSSPATSLSSRRTADDGGPPAPAQAGPAPGSLEAELRSRPFVCTVEGCGKAYIRAEHLKRHVRSIHTNDKPYECPHPGCGREFSRYDNLCQHYKGVHGPTSSSALRDMQRS